MELIFHFSEISENGNDHSVSHPVYPPFFLPLKYLLNTCYKQKNVLEVWPPLKTCWNASLFNLIHPNKRSLSCHSSFKQIHECFQLPKTEVKKLAIRF